MAWRTGYTLLVVVAMTIGSVSCRNQHENGPKTHVVTDAYGRRIVVPDSIRSVIGLGSGALRLICYMDLADKTGYIEGNEKRRETPYIMANPDLRNLEVIGAGNNYDTELLAASNADLLVTTFKTASEADRLQKLTQKPVFALKYGNLSDGISDFFNSLSLLGKAFGREGRSDSLISYISETISECESRVAAVYDPGISAYIGGVAFSGSHGITSTLNDYPPFRINSVGNAAAEVLNEAGMSGIRNNNTMVGAEQLIEWNPDFIFLDVAGTAIWENDISKPVFRRTMKAFEEGRIFTVLPYNWYSINYENVLCNTWFAGKVIYPRAFEDVNIEAKCREIYKFFLGNDIFDEMNELYSPFREAL
ncbi:MAG: ABC transporter substrate-binding protein [Bacteroidales bacterium]|jgi:iron complex transport system substrate-binding protein|nr:ABC transporter substrate-binding protein [Bacteroidales bacterium]